jgi:predicted ATPase
MPFVLHPRSWQPLGPADYLAICRAHHMLLVSNVPRMDILSRNEARRFITLVDAVYENKVGGLSGVGPSRHKRCMPSVCRNDNIQYR